MNKILNDILTLLEVNDIETSSHEVADMMWLGAIMDNNSVVIESKREEETTEKEEETFPNEDSSLNIDSSTNSNENRDIEDESVEPKEETGDNNQINEDKPLHLDDEKQESSSPSLSKGEYHKVPTPRHYTEYNQFATVLKILRQQSHSLTNRVFDEDATVEYIANTQIWDVVTKAQQEKKFTLSIIIEKSESMTVWEEMTKDFVSAVSGFLFFKELKVYYLKESEKEFILYSDKKCQSKVSVNIFHSLEQRSLTMLMSDCISQPWGDIRGYEFLKNITKLTPFMILNMLPQRIWKRTVLDDTWRIKFTHKEGWLNQNLISDIDEKECQVTKHIKVPMTTFDTISLKHWANLVAGKKENWLYGSLFEAKEFDKPPKAIAESQEKEDPVALVRDFEIFASPMAQKLAIYFSTVPLSLDIMKIVQKVSLPESSHTHLAEVFLSGLLKKTSSQTKSGKIIYEFVDGVKDILKDKLYLHKKIDVLKENSSFIAKDLGSNIDFMALMENPNLIEGIEFGKNDRVFAKIIADVFEEMGEEYGKVGKTIKKLEPYDFSNKYDFSKNKHFFENYINRDIDFIIEDKIEKTAPELLFITGHGGVGKSTLLKKFFYYNAKKIPIVYINLRDRNINSFVDILLDEDITSVKHCPSFEKIRTILLKEPKLLNAIIKSDTDVVESQIEEYDKEWGEYAKLAIDGFKFGAKFLKNADEKKKKEFLNNPEFVLLSALAEDFEDYGLFMVDTFEKIKTNDIKSKINFTDSGELSMRLKEKHYRLKDYIEGLIYLLVGSCTFIVAGRNSQNEHNMEVPLDYSDELSLENFSFSNIKELFSIHVEKDKKLSMPSDERIEQIKELTNGNPLIVGLFPKVAKEYDSWDELDYKEMERRIKTDEEFGLLFYMTDRVLSHLEEYKEVWKLVIPRVLNAEIEKLLFKDEKILKELIEFGLAIKGTGKYVEQYYLYDDVYRAIVVYYEREFKNGFSSWHDAKVVADLHRELMGFYEKHMELYRVNSAFEGCYHKMMLREGFEREFEVQREEFSNLLLGSIGLNNKEKFRICSSLNTMSIYQTTEIIKTLLMEKKQFLALMSQKLYKELTNKAQEGNNLNVIENLSFLIKLSKSAEFKEEWILYSYIGEIYSDKEEYQESIESYQKAIQLNPQNDDIYFNLGTLYKKIEKYDNAIECYLKALQLNPLADWVYYNLGNTYDIKKDYQEAIEAYQKAIELNPEHHDYYYNLGGIYSYIKNYDKAIEFYQKAIEIDSGSDDAYCNMGSIFAMRREYDKAIISYEKAIEINPENNDAYVNIRQVNVDKKEITNLNIEPLYISTGQPVYGKNKFFPRDKIINNIWRRLNQGKSLLLTAPRRVGKSSILHYIKNNPQEGCIVKYLSVMGVNNSNSYFKLIYNALLENNEIYSLASSYFEKAKTNIKNLSKKIRSIELKGFEIDSNEQIDYYSELTELLISLPSISKRIIFLMDAFPETLSNIARYSQEEAIKFLQDNRRLQENHDIGIQFIIAGDISFSNTVRSLTSDSYLKNYLTLIDIPPLDYKEASLMIDRLCLGLKEEKINLYLSSEVKTYLLQKIVQYFPYYIQIIIDELVDEGIEDVDEKDIDLVIDKIIKSRSSADYFSNWKTSLGDAFEEKEEKVAIKILSHISQNDTMNYEEMKRIDKNVDIKSIIEVLEHDGYINKENNLYLFNSPLLKAWWEYKVSDNFDEEINLEKKDSQKTNQIDDKKEITFNCEECSTPHSIDCDELEWESVSSSDRGMGAEVEYEAEYYDECNNCNNDMNITFSCWEYPVGTEETRDVPSSNGVVNLKGNCCLDLTPREDRYFDDADMYDDGFDEEVDLKKKDNQKTNQVEDGDFDKRVKEFKKKLFDGLSKISRKKEVNIKCPYDSERLHKNQNSIINISLENLKNLFFEKEKKDLDKKILVEKMGNKLRKLPVIMLTNKAVNISKTISSTIDTNQINDVFIDALEKKCERKIWNNDTYRLMTLDEESNNLILGKSNYYKTLSTCHFHYYNFMNHNNSMIQCKGEEYEAWFEKLKNIVLYNQFTTVSASMGCSTLLVIKNYRINKFQYYIVDNSRATNPANTKHVVPSFMFQPTKKTTDKQDFQLQSNIQTQILKEFGEELLGIAELEQIDNHRELELVMKKNKDLERIQKLLNNGKATLKVLGLSLDIFRLQPELLTVLIVDDEKFYNNFHPKTSWKVSRKDRDGLSIYNIDDEEMYLELIFNEKKPLVSSAIACLKLGRDYVLSNYYN